MSSPVTSGKTVESFLAYCDQFNYGPHYDQWFCNYFAAEYEQATERLLNDDSPLTDAEESLYRLLMWQDERLPMLGDWRLARDHEARFVYALASWAVR